MKVAILQPKYYTDYAMSEKAFEDELSMLDLCDDTLDIIVMPEASDVPALAHTREEFLIAHGKFTPVLLTKAKETAKRCSAILFVSGYDDCEGGIRNTTFAINREGEIVGKYYKQHLTPGEVTERKLDSDYSFEFSEPYTVEIEGIRFGFLTCYDFYFYEAYSNIARQNVDVMIGCSHQRSDTHAALEIMTRHLAYNTNAYVLRSSVVMNEDKDIGGASMAVAPNGDILLQMKNRVGVEFCEIDPTKKYYKPGGYGNPDMAHYEYVEKGRRPYKYRPAGSAIVPPDRIMPYPRLCAHRGWKTVAPENSMPALGAAISLGAEEIEFDLWPTKDGEIVSIHDKTLDRVSDGTGLIYEHTYEELLSLDFGIKHGEKFKGLKIIKFEEILKKFSCHAIMNVHIKTKSNTEPADDSFLKAIIKLVYKYDAQEHVYFMSGNPLVQKRLFELAPKITRCMGAGDDPWGIVDNAIALGCKKVQLFGDKWDESMVKKAKEHGIICNAFYSDEVEKAKRYLDMGIDTILTNDYQIIDNGVREDITRIRKERKSECN